MKNSYIRVGEEGISQVYKSKFHIHKGTCYINGVYNENEDVSQFFAQFWTKDDVDGHVTSAQASWGEKPRAMGTHMVVPSNKYA